jgi:hypothetical protein
LAVAIFGDVFVAYCGGNEVDGTGHLGRGETKAEGGGHPPMGDRECRRQHASKQMCGDPRRVVNHNIHIAETLSIYAGLNFDWQGGGQKLAVRRSSSTSVTARIAKERMMSGKQARQVSIEVLLIL